MGSQSSAILAIRPPPAILVVIERLVFEDPFPMHDGGTRTVSAMVNREVSSIGAVFAQLMLEQMAREYVAVKDDGRLDEPEDNPENLKRIEGWLGIADKVAEDFEILAAQERTKSIRKRIKRGISKRELAMELRVLRETLGVGLNYQFLYRYPNAKRGVFEGWKEKWAGVLTAFPSSYVDVVSGVDLWALRHSTASVFHMMRVLEHGLRALALDVGRTFDTQNWQQIVNEIEAEVRDLGKILPRGEAKSERIRFLSTAAKEFIYFKDGWRNYVSHNRSCYTDDEAESVMNHVRQFMLVLSERLSEAPSE